MKSIFTNVLFSFFALLISKNCLACPFWSHFGLSNCPPEIAEFPLTPTSTPQWQNINGYWRLVELNDNLIDGTLIPATVGMDGVLNNPNNVTFHGDITANSNRDSGLGFIGQDEDIKIPDYNGLHFTNALSISFWAKKTRNGFYERILYKDNNLGNEFVWGVQYIRDGRLEFNVGNTNIDSNFYVRSSSEILDTKWHHFVVTYTSCNNETSIYIDGSLDSRGSPSFNYQNWPTGLEISNGVLRLGSVRYNGNTFYGRLLLQDVALWNSTLSASEVLQIYRSQLGN